MIDVAELRRIDLFEDVDDAGLAEFAAATEPREAAPGDVLAEEGQTPAATILLFEGSAQTFLVDNGRTEPVGRQVAPTWMGAIAVLTEGLLGVRMQADSPCRLGAIAGADFRRLALAHPAVHRRIMHQVGPVMSRVTGWEQNRERLASLGTMAAGLAHELNNPAAAAQRAAAQLAEALDVIGEAIGTFVDAGVERVQAAELVELQRRAKAGATGRTALDALDAADAEDEVLDRLEKLGVSEPWRLAEPLASAGVGADWLEEVHDAAGPSTEIALRWIAATLTAQGLASELQESTRSL
jgi:CRP-like cAMP-binding protein